MMTGYGIQYLNNLPAGIKTLLLSSFLIPLGSFTILPFIPVILNKNGNFELETVGVVLAITSLVQFCGGFFGGFMADRFGLKLMMVRALLIRVLGFIALTFSYWHNLLMIPAVILIALGSAFYMPANKAYTVNLFHAEKKALFLSISNSAFNAGMAFGPLIGALFILRYNVELFGTVAMVFLLLFFIHFKNIPEDRACNNRGGNQHYLSIVDFKVLLTPFTFNIFTFYLYFFFQNYISLYVIDIHSPGILSLVLFLNASLVFFAQPMLSKSIDRVNYSALLSLSFILMATGMLFISHGAIVSLFFGTALLSFSEICLFLKNDLEMLSKLPDKPAVAFGFQRLSAGIGAAVSGVLGGFLFGAFNENLNLFWQIIAIQSLILSLLCFLYQINSRKVAKR